ncbi:MAG: hypothetical protein GKR87_01655 [Kiritimatiellae bacterium]|nr:hypothetical protein [Kiritimatiellia bacterium]
MIATVTTSLLLYGCGNKPRPGSTPAIDAAIVPGADFLIRVKTKEILKTPFVKEAIEKQKKKTAGLNGEQSEAFFNATGLTKEDIESLLISADTDNVYAEVKKGKNAFDHMNAVVAFGLGKPLTLEKLKSGLATMLEKEGAQISEIKINNAAAIHIQSPRPDAANVSIALSQDQKIVYATINQESLKEVLKREENGNVEKLSEALISVEKALPADPQVRMAFLASETIQQNIMEAINTNKDNPGAAMMLGFIKLLQNLKSVSLGMTFHSGAELNMAADLGEEEAQQASVLLNTMVIPMLQANLVKQTGDETAADALKVEHDGTTLKMGFKITEKQMGLLSPATP